MPYSSPDSFRAFSFFGVGGIFFLPGFWVGGFSPPTPLGRTHPGPATLRRNFKFRLIPFPAPAGQRANPWFALCTPCSFSAARRGIAKQDEGVQGENHRLTPWSTGVETIMGAKNLIFCDGCRARGPAEGCWGEKPPTKIDFPGN